MTISERILDCFARAGYDADIYVANIYEAAYELHGQSDTPFRRQQQRLGARFSVLNKQFDKGKHAYGRIVPGKLKRTYRLVRV